MNNSPVSSPATSPISERVLELCQQRDAFSALLENTAIGLDAVHIRALQEWLDASNRELAQIESDVPR